MQHLRHIKSELLSQNLHYNTISGDLHVHGRLRTTVLKITDGSHLTLDVLKVSNCTLKPGKPKKLDIWVSALEF